MVRTDCGSHSQMAHSRQLQRRPAKIDKQFGLVAIPATICQIWFGHYEGQVAARTKTDDLMDFVMIGKKYFHQATGLPR